MKMYLVISLAFLALFRSSLLADMPDISEKSSDGKWIFKAHWFGDKGYQWELQNTTTHKTYFSKPPPAENEGLPARINALWSPDHRYLAINDYYGRILYGIEVIALSGDAPSDQVKWPTPTEASMIKSDDRKTWSGEGVANCSADEWAAADTLVIDIAMRAELDDKTSGQKYRIYSVRQMSVQFTDLTGKVLSETLPEYDKQPASND